MQVFVFPSACYIPPLGGQNARFYPPGTHGRWDPEFDDTDGENHYDHGDGQGGEGEEGQ